MTPITVSGVSMLLVIIDREPYLAPLGSPHVTESPPHLWQPLERVLEIMGKSVRGVR